MVERQVVQVSGSRVSRVQGAMVPVVALALLAGLVAGCFPNLPAVSPDGKYVAVCLTPRGEFVAEPTPYESRPRDLYIAPIDGSGVWRVTSLSTQFGEGADRVADLYQAAEPAFSPDGTKLAFVIRHLGGSRTQLVTDKGWVVVIDLTNQLGIDLGTNRTWSLRDIAASAEHPGVPDVPMAIAVDNAHALTPRFSPDSTRLAWIETREWNEQPANKDELGERIGASGFHGQLRVAELRAGEGLVPLAVPDGFDAVIPEVSWRSNETLIAARRVGMRRGGDPMFSCQAELCELQLENRVSRVVWTGALSAWHVGVSAHPAGPVVVDQVWVRHNRSKLLLIDPAGAVGANATELVAGEADVAPRFDFTGNAPVLRWLRQTGVKDTTAGLSMCALGFDAAGKPVGEVTERTQTVDVSKWGASRITPVSFIRYLATGSSGAMIYTPGRGIYPLEGRPEPLGVNASDRDNYNGQQLMLSTGGAFNPMMGGLVNRINTFCPDERALIEVARRTLYPRLGGARITDSVMLFDVTIRQRNNDGEPVKKTGQYREMVAGDRIRTEETYAGTDVKIWDGRTVRHKTGTKPLVDLDPANNPMNQAPFDELKEQLDERLRLRRLFLLESLEDPAPGELAGAGKFSLRMHSRQGSVVLESGSRSLVYLRRFSAFKKANGEAVIEEVYIGFEILGGATVRAWPREVRTRSYWMRSNAQGGAAVRQTTSVIRFTGSFEDWAVSHPSNPRYLVNLPTGIRIYEADADRHSPEHAFDIQNNEPSVDARLVKKMPYPFANRGRKEIHSGINQGLPPQCFTREGW